MKTAIVYDRVNKWGGAERVLLSLHEIFPDAPLYTSVYDEKNAPWAKVFPKVHTSFLQKLPFARSNHELLPVLMPLAFESFDFSEFDLVISVTSEAAKGIHTKPGTLHLCYCLTPTRYLWSHYDEYFKNDIFRFITKPLVKYLQGWDRIAAKRPDVIVGISNEVAKRIKKYYKRGSEVVFPPVAINPKSKNRKPGKYYLVVSRLVVYKKVDLAVRAFNKLKLPLTIIGIGKEENSLRRIAKSNIKFVKHVSEKELTEYYKRAKALIMPQEEDFGIVALEAQAQGVPVIAFKKGGALDSVIDGKTGIFFEKQNVGSLMRAVKKFARMRFRRKTLKDNAKRFSKENFKRRFLALIE